MATVELLKKLADYVPTPITQEIYRHPHIQTEPAARRFPAAVLFSDISGFTPLSELLAQAGPTGAEELTQLINQYFTRMIQTIETYHGQVVKFSGDALTVLFPAEEITMAMAVRRAGECALAMQTKMDDFAHLSTSCGEASLSMKVSVGAGEILECIVGGVLGRWEYVVAGDPLAQVAMAEHEARPGQVILSPQAWELAQEFFAGTPSERNPDFVNLSRTITPLPKLEPVSFDWSQLDSARRQVAEEALQCFVPGAIKARLNEQADWLAELRRMTVVFVGIGGIDFDAAEAGLQLQNFLQATQEIVYRFEGSLGKVAVDDKGTILLILFGAPPFSHVDDSARAATFALSLQTIAQEQNLRIAIGITEGQVFAGPVGAPSRREYTVIGDEVNLAARLMQYGGGGKILVSDRVKERAGPRFITENLGKISVKGKAGTLPAYLLKAEQGTQEEFVMRYLLYDEPMVGRTAEMTQIRQVARRAKAGKLQLLFIEGELGSGKSRLVAEMVREWMTSGAVGYGGKYISYGQQVPYQAWREILSAIYGLTSTLEPQRQLARLAFDIDKLEDPPEQPDYWAVRLPLLADVLGLDVPENDFTRHISSQLRRDNTFVLIEALLRRQAQHRPLLIVLEDIHWADELSLALAVYLARALIDLPLMLVLVYRPSFESNLHVLAEAKDFLNADTISLSPLSSKESLQLIDDLLGHQPLLPEVVETLLSWGQGNPLFLHEIAGSILDVMNGQIDPWLKLPKAFDLPQTVHDVVLARVDRLSEAEKLTLKVASVIGTRFQRSLLAEIHPTTETRYQLSLQLDTLEHTKLLRLETPAPKWEYSFRSVITQEVVYEGLLLAQRRQLHAAVGVVLENLTPDEVETLAFHYSRSGNLEKGFHYLKIAAEKARREYANQVAIDYYSQALSLLSDRSASDGLEALYPPEYSDVLLERAKLYNLIGRRDDASEDLGELGLIAEALGDNRLRALAMKQWAYLYESSGDYDSALELIERFMQLAQEAGDEPLMGEAYNHWGKLLYSRREYETAENHLQQALGLAQKYQDDRAQADCFNSLGLVAYYQTSYDPSYYDVALYFLKEASGLWRGIGNQVGLAESLSHEGLVQYGMGRYMAAQQAYSQSLSLYRTVGDRLGDASTRLGLGQIYRTLGQYETARRYLEEALATYQTIGDHQGEIYTLCHLGFLFFRVAEYDQARTFLEEALLDLRGDQTISSHLASQNLSIELNILQTMGKLDDLLALGKTLTYYGWTLLSMGQPHIAQKYLEEAMRIKRETQQKAAAVEDMAHLGKVALDLNKPDLANTYARHALDFVTRQGVRGIEHPAVIYLNCYHILQANGKYKQANSVLKTGWQYVASRIAEIDAPELTNTYLTNIPENYALKALVNQSAETE